MAPSVALQALLADTGLPFSTTPSGAILVGDPTPGATQGSSSAMAAGRPTQESDKSSASFRVAQVDQGQNPGAASIEGASGTQGAQIKLEEVTVTAQKREERLQSVPISISVLGGAQLDRSTVDGVTEALNEVPGVSAFMHTNQGGGTFIAIRGVSANSPVFGGASPVAYYLDSVPFGFVKFAIGPDVNAYDLERVEVLRGPQGTLYGANAQNGVVRVLTQDADLDKFDIKARASGSRTEDGGGNYRADMALNVPVIADKLAARLVVGADDLSGWIDRPVGNNDNDERLRNARVKLNAQPTDNLSIGLSTWLSRQFYGGISSGFITPQGDERRNTYLDESIRTDFDAYGLKVAYDLPRVSITSATSYLDYRSRDTLDLTDYGSTSPDAEHYDASVFAEEVNLASKQEGPWRWTAGAMYRNETDGVKALAPAFALDANIKNGSKSYALFGEINRRLLGDKLELTLGGRYFHDHIFSKNVNLDLRPTASFNSTTPRAVLTWYVNDVLTTYASYSEGFRSGALNDPGSVPPSLEAVRPDKLKNYEMGAKGGVLDGRITFDTAVYYIQWKDVQQKVDENVNGLAYPALVNAPSASGIGFDFGVTTRPLVGLTFAINLDWNDLKADSEVLSGAPPAALFNRGDRLNFSPEYTAGTSAHYLFPLGAKGYAGRLSASANYTSAQSFRTLIGQAQSIAAGKSIVMAHAGFTLVTPEHWELTIFGDNLTNEKGPLFGDPFVGVHVPDGDVRPRPRTLGIQVDYHR